MIIICRRYDYIFWEDPGEANENLYRQREFSKMDGCSYYREINTLHIHKQYQEDKMKEILFTRATKTNKSGKKLKICKIYLIQSLEYSGGSLTHRMNKWKGKSQDGKFLSSYCKLDTHRIFFTKTS